MSLAGKVAIVGIGQTAFGKGLVPPERALACEAIIAALDDAGIPAQEIDAVSSYTMEATPDYEIVRSVGLGPLHFFSQAPHGGGAGPAAVGHAALAIASGVARNAVVWRARKRSGAGSRVWAQTGAVIEDVWKWSRPSGILRPVDEVAITTRRYFHEYGDGSEALATVATTLRDYAQANPAAMMHGKPMSREAYFQSRMVADPLRLFDNCLESDGACALVLTSAERARDLPGPAVLIEGFSQGLVPGTQPMPDFHRTDTFTNSSAITAANLWRQTDLTPAAVDVAQFYDAFSPLILFSLEAYGFCGRGEARDFILSQGIGAGGALPVNTAGGSLSEAYLHGMNLILEGVRQLRGTAATPVADARVALVTGCDATPNGALLLRRPD
ncbi:thiolase C-terminal domain-containing protein [Sphingobium estronivorans]|uniref:thiolase C-terminal domain-containing protein n=1 Tax=Sphingobium estronivorans TaxID=1577690 RepID=UPI00123B6CBA|nr:lipid-transfer protein [Sphingobium estronivorans]